MANIARRMAMDMQCISTARTLCWHRNIGDFFPYVERDIVPQLDNGYEIPQAITAIKENIQFLFFQILDETVALDDEELEAAYQLWFDTWMEGKEKLAQGELSSALFNRCQATKDYVTNVNTPNERRISSDETYVIRAWGAVITYLLGDYHFFME